MRQTCHLNIESILLCEGCTHGFSSFLALRIAGARGNGVYKPIAIFRKFFLIIVGLSIDFTRRNKQIPLCMTSACQIQGVISTQSICSNRPHRIFTHDQRTGRTGCVNDIMEFYIRLDRFCDTLLEHLDLISNILRQLFRMAYQCVQLQIISGSFFPLKDRPADKTSQHTAGSRYQDALTVKFFPADVLF